MSKLFSPLTIRGITFKNRLVVSPMCQYSSADGFATDWHLVHLGSRAVGGAALVLTEATAVSAEARITLHDLGIWKDEHIPKLYQIAAFIKQQGSKAGIQLSHSGRKGSTAVPWKGRGVITAAEGGWQPAAPSSLPWSDHYPVPLALDSAGIQKVVSDFQSAAERALQAGFDVIEVHASHGYLLHQFLSPLTNERSDRYGGVFENRIRLLLEVVENVKAVMPYTSPLFVRIPGTDWAEGGWTQEEAVRLARILQLGGVDLIDVTTGGLVPHQKIPVGPAYQLPFASAIKKDTGVLTSTVGMITDAVQAESILVNGDADMIMMAREFLRSPYFTLAAARTLKEEVAWPIQYERAML